MSRIAHLNQRYAASRAVARAGVEIVVVGDPAGARFDAAVRRLVLAVRDDGSGPWDDLVGASKALRWRLLTQPQPMEFNQGLDQLIGEVARLARRLEGAIAEQPILDELQLSAVALAQFDEGTVVGAAVLDSCLEAGAHESVVVAASNMAKAGLESWLQAHGTLVLTAGELDADLFGRDRTYVVGPPRFYRSSLVTAPATDYVCFILPAWFGDRSVARSAIAEYAEGAIRVPTRVFAIGDTSAPQQSVPADSESEDAYLPQPVWGSREPLDREPSAEEVLARKILLSGNLAMWLDDGERIRSLDLQQPPGERVTYTDVPAVREGSYLLLRRGTTERGVMYQAALAELGEQAESVGAAQNAWKQLLVQRLQRNGYRQVAKDLRAVGVKRADRARAWTDPNLIRPHSDQDFETLLTWLGIPVQPTFAYASRLRKMLYKVSAEIGKQLEGAVSATDLTELETVGHLGLSVAADGFRGILATRVLAISPYSSVVSRHDARVPFEDRSAQWLE
ncbi:hypothetical protein [Agromyces sp. PvR057]|uniref:hypothetical protein n=1 Tax=Agromyces sp. PvR057 TaxID=3156403 RepID=UPI003395DD74